MDSDKETVVLVGQNLFFLGRVEALAEPLGYNVQWATTESVFWEFYASRQPALVLLDLEGDEAIWSNVLENIECAGAGAGPARTEGPDVTFHGHAGTHWLIMYARLKVMDALADGRLTFDGNPELAVGFGRRFVGG